MGDRDASVAPLCALRVGESGVCTSVDPACPLAGRLGDVGLRAGTVILCERRSLFGQPCAYRLGGSDGGCVIALRAADAGAVLVRRRAVGETEAAPGRPRRKHETEAAPGRPRRKHETEAAPGRSGAEARTWD